MDIGYGCKIFDKWIPKGEPTGWVDIQGKEIRAGDIVSLTGSTSKYAVVCKFSNGFYLAFGSNIGSVGWQLDVKTIEEHNVCVTEKVGI
ncbi:hypothetical protein D3C81_06800 [compost metagenome]